MVPCGPEPADRAVQDRADVGFAETRELGDGTVGRVRPELESKHLALDMAPTKGFPLPMISFGGSSLVSTLASLGMLLSVSEHEG